MAKKTTKLPDKLPPKKATVKVYIPTGGIATYWGGCCSAK